jgi:hypothetical protein
MPSRTGSRTRRRGEDQLRRWQPRGDRFIAIPLFISFGADQVLFQMILQAFAAFSQFYFAILNAPTSVI